MPTRFVLATVKSEYERKSNPSATNMPRGIRRVSVISSESGVTHSNAEKTKTPTATAWMRLTGDAQRGDWLVEMKTAYAKRDERDDGERDNSP